MLLTYLKITAVSLPLIVMLALSPAISDWRNAIVRQRAFWVTGLLLFALFFWPSVSDSVLAQGELAGGRLARVILLPMIGFYWLYRISKVPNALKSFSAWVFWLGLYWGWALISVWYSPDSMLSLWKCFEYLVLILFALGIRATSHTLSDYADLFYGCMFLILAVCVFSLVGIVLEPDLSISINPNLDDAVFSSDRFSRWGIFPLVNPNTLAQLGAILSAVAIVEFYRASSTRILVLWLIVLIGLSCVLAAHSRTSLFALAFMLMLIAYFLRKGGLLFVYLSIAVLFGFVAIDQAQEYILRGQTFEQFSSLTGRTLIWDLAWAKFLDSPIWGWGFYAGHLDLDVSHIISKRYSSVDNTYLEILVDLGVVGLVIMIGALVAVARNVLASRVWRSIGGGEVILWVQALVVAFSIMVRSATGPTFQVFHLNTYLLIVVASVFSALVCARRYMANASHA